MALKWVAANAEGWVGVLYLALNSGGLGWVIKHENRHYFLSSADNNSRKTTGFDPAEMTEGPFDTVEAALAVAKMKYGLSITGDS